VDIEAATRAGIKVARIPSAGTGNALSCAEHSIYLILSLLRYQVWLLGHSFSSQQMCRFMELGFYYSFFPD
jgi:phosphoglycerate dehydrogenase-like enzyme